MMAEFEVKASILKRDSFKYISFIKKFNKTSTREREFFWEDICFGKYYQILILICSVVHISICFWAITDEERYSTFRIISNLFIDFIYTIHLVFLTIFKSEKF
jgi:hypothetical protein